MQEDFVYLNLDFMPPTAERLCMLPENIRKRGYRRIYLNIIDNFPWSFEQRLQSSTAYSEAELDYFVKSCSKLNLKLSYIFPESGSFLRLLRCNGYRRMSLTGTQLIQIDPEAVGVNLLMDSA